MSRVHCTMAALIVAAWTLLGCQEEKAVQYTPPATLEESGEKGIMKVRLTERAAERIGIETVQIREETVTRAGGDVTRKVVPYGAIMYDKKGATWTFTNPEPLVFVRSPITVENIDGDRVVLAEGPPAGTAVVMVGAAELMGAEHKYGH
ncbi:MAG TPA: hypothetical protein VFD07_04320 [Candidatus Krumholzibacteria bacterium]|jgi:hypothetical protein|nr:hypothetical protein [Candidatus Krumholzibacteria bacterium]